MNPCCKHAKKCNSLCVEISFGRNAAKLRMDLKMPRLAAARLHEQCTLIVIRREASRWEACQIFSFLYWWVSCGSPPCYVVDIFGEHLTNLIANGVATSSEKETIQRIPSDVLVGIVAIVAA